MLVNWLIALSNFGPALLYKIRSVPTAAFGTGDDDARDRDDAAAAFAPMSGFEGVRLARAPANTVIYAVGDIHGRRDLLDAALDEIGAAARRAAATGGRTVAVFIGDYIDRGPDSRGVIESLIRFGD